MIIWGGGTGSAASLNTGARYSPSTDSWTATTTTGAPVARRAGATAVWTGSEMIVWGGRLISSGVNSGGRYNPSTDSWAATTTTGAPSGREDHTAVWTGGEMIVWGGFANNYANTGGRYNPSTDTWVATSTTNAPAVRYLHTAVWTGNELIVWGGEDDATELNTGGHYNPSIDSWVPTTTIGAPADRQNHAAVWTGSEMIVWGGNPTSSTGSTTTNTGGRYDPSTDSWVSTTINGAPAGRSSHTAVWTGTEMIVWGGIPTTNTGGRYNPLTDSWVATTTTGAPAARSQHTAVWTGSEMTVWGGDTGSTYLNTGGRYNPSADSWVATTTVGAPAARTLHTAVWTGNEMIVWGGINSVALLNTGGRYDPSTDSWMATTTTGAPIGRDSHTMVWTGSELIVWGGWVPSQTMTGGRYNPSTDSWVATTTTGAPIARYQHAAVWAGTEMIVWGGYGSFTPHRQNTGGRYNPSTDSWVATTTTGAPAPRYLATAVWTGSEMIVWGGSLEAFPFTNTGGRYVPGNAGVVCRAATSDCDTAELCTGSSASCPVDAFRPSGTACIDGSACTTNDACDGAGVCVGGQAVSCDDDNVCTTDSCDPVPGCVFTSNTGACDDGDACTIGDACGGGACVAGSPVVCAAPDPCHQAGVCQPGSGACTYANQPDGTTCDDGDSNTTEDACQSGICIGGASCGITPKPKSAGYYKKLCKDGHSHPSNGDELTAADAACVAGATTTFSGISTVDDICGIIESNNHDAPHGDGDGGKHCDKAEDELMALALNICRQRVCPSQEVDSHCLGDGHDHTLTTVAASLTAVDAILFDPNRDKDTCKDARCLATEINNGHGLHHTSLLLTKESGNKVRLNWGSPVMDDGTGEATGYSIWRRTMNSSDAFVLLQRTSSNTVTYVDATAGSWEYEVTFTIEP